MKKVGIKEAFKKAKTEGRVAFVSYFVYGYPDDQSFEEVFALLSKTSDLVEIGFPFSDPLADGTTIQEASEVALKNNPTLDGVFNLVSRFRSQGLRTPYLLMSYFNPVYQYGLKKFCHQASKAGLNGVIFPDLPIEEASEWLSVSRRSLDTVFLVSPLTEESRIDKISRKSGGFIYCLSVLGVTGVRQGLPVFLKPFLKKVRSYTSLPLAVGFGFSQPSQIKSVKHLTDGIIVGSALINSYNQGKSKAEKISFLEAKIKSLKKAL